MKVLIRNFLIIINMPLKIMKKNCVSFSSLLICSYYLTIMNRKTEKNIMLVNNYLYLRNLFTLISRF